MACRDISMTVYIAFSAMKQCTFFSQCAKIDMISSALLDFCKVTVKKIMLQKDLNCATFFTSRRKMDAHPQTTASRLLKKHSSFHEVNLNTKTALLRRTASFGGGPIVELKTPTSGQINHTENHTNPSLRWIILFLACCLLFGNFYAYDNPAALNIPLQVIYFTQMNSST
jgi:hypothetical protein